MNDTDPQPLDYLIETDDASFERDVFERSKQAPVVVDFWANWCGPCKVLAPILEDLAREFAGRFILVKADTDHVPQAASEFQVQGIPAVYAVCNGDVVDYFQGALPEAQVRQWLEQVFLRQEFQQATSLEAADPAAAAAAYSRLLDKLPDAPEIQIGLARVRAKQESFDEAKAIIAQLEARGFLEPEAQAVKAQIELGASAHLDLPALRAAVENEPHDNDRALELARALAGHGQHVEAMEICLQIIGRNKAGGRDAARELMVDILRVVSDEELVRDYRRKLSMALY